MRRLLVLLLAAGLLGAGATAVDAKPRKKSPRLHAFASCSNLLGYAQRNGLRVIRDTPVAPAPPPGPRGGGGTAAAAAGEDRAGAPGPVAAPAPAAGGEGTSQTNVQEAGVDEPDWVKAAGTTLYVARRGQAAGARRERRPPARARRDRRARLHAGAARARRPRARDRHDRVRAGRDRRAGAARRRRRTGSGRTQLLEVDVSDPARMRVLRTLDVEGSYLSARLTGATAAGHRADRAARARDADDAGPNAGDAAARLARSVRRTRTRAWLPSAVVPRPPHAARRGAARSCAAARSGARSRFTGLGTLTVLTIDMERGLPAVDADALMTDGDTVYASQDRLYVATQRWLERRDAQRDPRRVRHRAARVLDRRRRARPTAQRRGPRLPAQPVVAVRARGRAARGDHVDAAVDSGASGREPRAHAAGARRAAGAGRQRRRARRAASGSTRCASSATRGYVVTFRQTDPLYTLDLSDPARRAWRGELKIPGYSAYLHPVGDGLLLGVGQDADRARAGARARSSRCSTSPTSPTRRLHQHGARRALLRGRGRPPRVPVVGAGAARGECRVRPDYEGGELARSLALPRRPRRAASPRPARAPALERYGDVLRTLGGRSARAVLAPRPSGLLDVRLGAPRPGPFAPLPLTASSARGLRCSPHDPASRRLSLALATTCAALALTAAPSMAVVGGSNAAPGEFPSVSEVDHRQGLPLHRHADRARTRAHRRALRLDHRRRRRRLAGRVPAAGDRRLHRLQQAGPGREGPGLEGHREPELPAQRRLRHLDPQAVAQLDQGADARSSGAGEAALWAPGDARGRSSASAPPRRAATRPTRCRRRRCRSRPTPTAPAPTATSTRPRWCAPATRRAASTPARATPAARCSAATPPARCASWARRASARAARGPASRASTPAWVTTDAARVDPLAGAQRRRLTQTGVSAPRSHEGPGNGIPPGPSSFRRRTPRRRRGRSRRGRCRGPGRRGPRRRSRARAAARRSRPSERPRRKPAENASPQPVVSTTSTVERGHALAPSASTISTPSAPQRRGDAADAALDAARGRPPRGRPRR